MKRNRTKKSLLLSVMSLLLCVSMFASSTYAWFTDEVSSGVNQIIAGNLDVELQHKNTGTTDYATVEGQTNLFKNALGNIILWEPGAMAYETFKVSNVGTLALKYKLNFNNVGNNYVTGTTRSLLDVIKVGIVDDTLATTREAVIAQVTTWTTLTDYLADASSEGHLLPGANKEFSVVLYWEPGTNDFDNQYNLKNGLTSTDGNPLYVDLGLTLVATQDTVESDSFNNQYDALAEYPVDQYAGISSASAVAPVTSGKATLTAGAAPSNTNNTTSVAFTGLKDGNGSDLGDGDTVKLVADSKNVIASEDFAVSTGDSPVAVIDLSLQYSDGGTAALADAKFDSAVVTTYITKGIDTATTTLTIQWTDGTNSETWSTANGSYDTDHGVTYDPVTGELKFTTTHFSEYVVYNNVVAWNADKDVVYTSLKTAIDSADAKNTIVLLADTDLRNISNDSSYRIPVSKSITIDGNGYTAKVAQRGFGVGMNATSNIDVTFKNINILNNSSGARCIDTRGNLNSLTLENVTLSTNGATGKDIQPLTIGGNQADAATINIKNSTIQTNDNATAYYAIITFNRVNMTIENSTIKGWACIYAKGPNGSAGSAGSTFTIKNSNLVSKNIYNGESNAFAMFKNEDSNITYNVVSSNLKLIANSDQSQAIASSGDTALENVIVNIDSNSNIEKIGDNAIYGMKYVTVVYKGEVVYTKN